MSKMTVSWVRPRPVRQIRIEDLPPDLRLDDLAQIAFAMGFRLEPRLGEAEDADAGAAGGRA